MSCTAKDNEFVFEVGASSLKLNKYSFVWILMDIIVFKIRQSCFMEIMNLHIKPISVIFYQNTQEFLHQVVENKKLKAKFEYMQIKHTNSQL